MKRQTPKADSEAATYAIAARQLAKAKITSVKSAFVSITRDIPRVTTAQRSRMFNPVEFLTPAAQLDAEHRAGRLRTLRLDLESTLLHLDACCSPALGLAGAWPTHDELKLLEKLVRDAAAIAGKRTPPTWWRCCQKVDRYFPKLRLCKRVTSFVTRIAESVPPRPLAALMAPAESEVDALAKKFFTILRETREGERDAATVEWIDYKPLMVRCQNAELARTGKAAWTGLRPRRGEPSRPAAIEAYVAFLELDRADLIWTNRHWRKLRPVLFWTETLGVAALLQKLEPFIAGTHSPVPLCIEQSEELEILLERARAAARKAKSREKLGKKV